LTVVAPFGRAAHLHGGEFGVVEDRFHLCWRRRRSLELVGVREQAPEDALERVDGLLVVDAEGVLDGRLGARRDEATLDGGLGRSVPEAAEDALGAGPLDLVEASELCLGRVGVEGCLRWRDLNVGPCVLDGNGQFVVGTTTCRWLLIGHRWFHPATRWRLVDT